MKKKLELIYLMSDATSRHEDECALPQKRRLRVFSWADAANAEVSALGRSLAVVWQARVGVGPR
jgi:hypothetical protein